MGTDHNDEIMTSFLRGQGGCRRRRGPAAMTRRAGGGTICVSVLLMLGWAVVGSRAILELEAHPDSITNERTATFTYVCTQLDVSDETATCGVEVCAIEEAGGRMTVLFVAADARTRL